MKNIANGFGRKIFKALYILINKAMKLSKIFFITYTDVDEYNKGNFVIEFSSMVQIYENFKLAQTYMKPKISINGICLN